MVEVFCSRLGWGNLELLVSRFQARLHFGVKPELCDLLRLPSLDGPLARVLHDAGHVDPGSLARLQPSELELVLRDAKPFHRYARIYSILVYYCTSLVKSPVVIGEIRNIRAATDRRCLDTRKS